MKIDIFPHILPPKYLAALRKKAASDAFSIGAQVEHTPGLTNLDMRLKLLEKLGDVVQVLNIAGPAIESIVGPEDAIELCKRANNEMAELLFKHPDRFVGAVACLPMNDIDAALKEAERAIQELRFRGVQIYSNINGEPLDLPKFKPLFEKMVNYNLPILIHPQRDRSVPDYQCEQKSKYMANVMFGWPYETALAMSRLVFSGILEDYPNLKVVTHHCGGMVPYFAQRIKGTFDYNEVSLGIRFRRLLQKHPIEYFRSFYGDTAVYGSTSALMCGYAFFGAERLLFGTDMPFDSQFGERYTRDTICSIEQMDINKEDKRKIFEDNSRHLFNLAI